MTTLESVTLLESPIWPQLEGCLVFVVVSLGVRKQLIRMN